MYKIVISAEAQTDFQDLEKLHGIECQEDFTDYLNKNLSGLGLSSGIMNFEYWDGKLFTRTEYLSERKLTDSELAELVDYTQGQWSDGIGEGFEQEPCYYSEDGVEVYISPWFSGQTASATQTEL